MICLQTNSATPLLRNGNTFGRPSRKQPLKPLGGRPPITATGLKLSQMWWCPSLMRIVLPLLNTSSHWTRNLLRNLKVQQTARRFANEFWQQLSNDIQTVAATGKIKRMYEEIKCALGPIQTKTPPPPPKSASGEVITDKGKQMERWVEHYSELYSRENVVSSVLDSIVLPVMEDLDTHPKQEELCKAIDSLTCGKAPGNDGIPPDLIKRCKNTFLQPLLDILCQC